MSSMLEQAIVDAKALREAALKNAEQAIIEKYAPEIKRAVTSLLEENTKKVKYQGEIYEVVSEVEDGKMTIKREGEKPHVVMESETQNLEEEELLQEQEEAAPVEEADTGFQAPHAFNPLDDPDQKANYNSKFEEPIYEFNLQDFEAKQGAIDDMAGEQDTMMGVPQEPDMGGDEDLLGGGEELGGGEDLGGGLDAGLGDLGALQESLDLEEASEDDIMEQIMSLLGEVNDEDEEIIEEELIVDASMQKNGTFETNQATLQYMQELELARQESTEYKEEKEVLEKRLEKLKENYKKLQLKNKQYKDVVEKINEKLNETLLSNAKLLYSNKTLSDASLNERQKSKIVEAIAKAKTPEEAKSLCEALNATVTSGNDRKKGPRTLSESVQRKSNLSGILPRRNKPASNEQHNFAEHMKKLAGIK